MADKERERFYIRKLWKCLVDPPAGQVVDCEPPDFRVDTPEGYLGIEVTNFYYPPAPGHRSHQEVQALKKRVIEMAERFHTAAGGPPLYLHAIFNERRALRKRSVPEIARSLADAVLTQHVPRSAREPSVEIRRSALPHEVPHVRVHGSVDGHDTLWTADAGGWVQKIHSHHVQAVITQKMLKAQLARTRCSRLWLVVVHDFLNGAAAADIADEALTNVYNHAFDRVLWFDPNLPRATDLRGRSAG